MTASAATRKTTWINLGISLSAARVPVVVLEPGRGASGGPHHTPALHKLRILRVPRGRFTAFSCCTMSRALMRASKVCGWPGHLSRC